MHVELNHLTGQVKLRVNEKLKEYDRQVEEMKKECLLIERERGTYAKNYEAIMGPGWNESEGGSETDKKRLLGKHNQMSDQNYRLGQAIRIGNEAEIIAKDTKIHLQADTEKLDRMHNNVRNINGELTMSDKLLNAIKKNESRNRIMLYTVVFIIFSAIVLLVVFKIMK